MTQSEPMGAVTSLFASRADTQPTFAAPSPVYPPQDDSGDNAFVDSIRNIPMPPIGPMPKVHFAPIPIMSGVSLAEGDEEKIVNKVEVTITFEDGSTSTIECEERNGGWWIPKDRLDG